MDRLRQLGLQRLWIYEVLISTFRGETPHAAPIGVWSDGSGRLLMDVYGGSHTLTNVLENDHFAANFPADVEVLHTALRAPERLSFAPARRVHAPVVAGCAATVELTLSSVTPSDGKVRLVGHVDEVYGAKEPRLINRAEGLLLESLVLVTRLDRQDAGAALATLTENHRVAAKVAPGSAYERALATLLRELRPSS